MIRRKEKTQQRVPFSDVAKHMDQGLEAVDPMRLAGLQNLQRARTAKDTRLQREEARLTQKLGANHPRVAMVKSQREANVEFQNDVAWGVSRAQTPPVASDPNVWTLHGHVRDKALHGLPDLTVALYDEKNQWIESVGHACTDSNGYFRLTYRRGGETIPKDPNDPKQPTPAEPVPQEAEAKEVKEADVAKAEKEKQRAAKEGSALKVKMPAQTARETPGASISSSGYQTIDGDYASGRGAYIHVTDAKGATLYVSDESFRPKASEVLYREIIIDGEGCQCAPPGKPREGDGKELTTGRYLGNKNNHELHDMNNVKPACQVDEIKASRRQFFTTQKDALAAGYDFCANCFGKDKSKR